LGRIETIEHTADIGLRISAESLEELFSLSARGMFSIIAELSGVEEKIPEGIELSAEEIEGLFVSWLGELLYRSSVKRMLFSGFEIIEISEKHLRASARGEPIDFEKHDLHTEIKAVTEYGLAVGRKGSIWTAEVFFDI